MDISYKGLSEFHGHSCPGLAVGYRASQIAVRNGFKRSSDEEIFAIVETDSCSVDAIQYILGCTFGKGNLFYRDYGKHVFTIVNRDTGDAIRISIKPGVFKEGLSMEEMTERILSLPEEELFTVKKFKMPKDEMPEEARIRKSVICEKCGEPVMETRTVKKDGKTLCIPCAGGDGV